MPVTLNVIGALRCVSALSLANRLEKSRFTLLKLVGSPLYPTKLADTNFPELSLNVATGKLVVSVGVMYTTRFPSASVSVFWKSTVGKTWSPSLATPVAISLSRPPVAGVIIALTFTVEPSFTKRSLSLISPVVGFTVSVAGTDPNDQELPFFVAVYVSSLGFVPSCGV